MKKLIISAILAAQSLCAGEWIACKDRMPPESDRVILWDDTHKCIELGMVDEILFYYAIFEHEGIRISHWMPLPIAPIIEQNSPRF